MADSRAFATLALLLNLAAASGASAQSPASWVGEHPRDASERPYVTATWHGANVSIAALVPFACGAEANAAVTSVQDTRIVIDVARVTTGATECMHELRVTVRGPEVPFGARIALDVRIGGRPIARGHVDHTPEHVMPPPHH